MAEKINVQKTLIPKEPDKVGYWITPREIYEQLNSEFHFDFDPCPYPRPMDYDGLINEWGKCSYVNPPFNNMAKWVHKAIEQNNQGKTIVMVLPVQRNVLHLIKAGAEFRPFEGVRWQNPEGKENKSGWPTALAILRNPKPKGDGEQMEIVIEFKSPYVYLCPECEIWWKGLGEFQKEPDAE